MQKKNTYRLVVSTLFLVCMLSFFSFPVMAQDTIELSDIEMSAALEYGPGSDAPLSSPFESGYVWISVVEPVKAKWTIYDPTVHRVTTIEHVPTIKQKITTGEHAGKWMFADRSAFTLPAFASKGTWLAKCEYILADGSTLSLPVSAVDSNIMYIGIPCTLSGSIVGNIFLYPWYFAGMKMPAYFWLPLGPIWGIAAIVIILIVWTRSIKGFVLVIRGAVDAGKEAIRSARYTR